MSSFVYHSPSELHDLGARIRDKAIQVTMDQADSYAQAQQAANSDATRSDTGQPTEVRGYETPTQGRPDDRANLQAYVSQSYDGIPDMFSAFALPNPDDGRSMLDSLYSVAATMFVDVLMSARGGSLKLPDAFRPIAGVSSVSDVHGFITGHLKGWQGSAAQAFADYITHVSEATVRQRELTISVAVALEAQLEISRRVNTDIWEIGQKTLKALEGLDAVCSWGSQETAVLTIAGAIAAVVFAGATAGAGAAALSAAIAVEGVQSVATTLSNVKDLKAKEAPIGGRTVPPVITGMQAAMNELAQTYDQLDRELADTLESYADSIYLNRDRLLIAPPDAVGRLKTATVAEMGDDYSDVTFHR